MAQPVLRAPPQQARQKPWQWSPLYPGEFFPCMEEYRKDVLTGMRERIWWQYYDSEQIDKADPTTQSQILFRTPEGTDGKTLVDTNMTTSGVLPDPEVFVVHFVSCYIYPMIAGALATFADLFLIMNNTILTFQINKKTYYQGLCWDFPSGGGQRTAGDLATPADYMWNGSDSQLAKKRLRRPCIIRRNQQFNWQLLVDPRAWDTLTSAANTYFYIVMEGDLYRQVT